MGNPSLRLSEVLGPVGDKAYDLALCKDEDQAGHSYMSPLCVHKEIRGHLPRIACIQETDLTDVRFVEAFHSLWAITKVYVQS